MTNQAFCVVTAANDRYYPLLQGLVDSIQRQRQVPLVVLDLGLSGEQKAALAEQAVAVVETRDDFPGLTGPRTPLWFRAMTARPFLPSYAPGFARYLWIDSDAWVQDWDLLEAQLRRMPRGRFGIVRERFRRPLDFVVVANGIASPIKSAPSDFLEKIPECWEHAFGPDLAQQQGAQFMYNSGVFMADAESPVWRAWQGYLAEALRRMRAEIDTEAFTSRAKVVEQTALNRALLDFPELVDPLPDLCNWCLHLGLPDWSAADGYIDPETGARIAVVHLVDFKALPCVPILCRDTGQAVAMSGRYDPAEAARRAGR